MTDPTALAPCTPRRSSRGARRTSGALRRRLGALWAVVTVAATVGCVSIPDAGPVRAGGPVREDVVGDFEYRPSGPAVDSTQDQLLRDFVEAGTGSADDYAVARQFLSRDFAREWDPRSGVVVRSGPGTVTRAGGSRLDYTVVGAATIDADGHYAQALTPSTTTLGFEFVREGDQWRISYAPDGIVLTTTNVDIVFRPHSLYFYDPTYSVLVPDERWFLARSSTSTRIAAALLAGPSPWLQGALASAFPEGTQLSLDAVTVVGGRARVDLTAEALSADPVERARMRAQLLASLSSVAAVTAVDLTVQAAVLEVPDPSSASRLRDPAVDPRPLVVVDGVLGHATSSGPEVLATSPQVTALDPVSVEASVDDERAVVGAADGAWLVQGDADAVRVDARPGLAPPALDGDGYAWTAPRDDARSLVATGRDGVAHQVSSKLPAGQSLVSFRVSRDGTRALVLLDVAGEARLLVTSVLRDARRVPLSLGDPVELSPPAGVPVGATWADENTVAVLTDVEGASEVSLRELGGEPGAPSRPTGRAVTIVGGDGRDHLHLLMDDGRVLEPRGTGWQDTGVQADLLATQR